MTGWTRGGVGMFAVTMLCLAATTAWAGLVTECFDALLNGVDRCGNLVGPTKGVPGEEDNATFCALVNTCTGKATGTARACVRNESCRLQIYCNNPGFGYIDCFSVCSSLYTVSANGCALLVATGYVVEPG
jgi:hypothetical protein